MTAKNNHVEAALDEALQAALEDDIELDPQENPVEIARDTLGRDILQVCLQEIRAIPNVWQKLPEAKQQDVIDRVILAVSTSVKKAVRILAADNRPTIDGILESVAIKDGIKATFKVSQMNPNRHELIDSQGKVCLLVVASAAEMLDGMDQVVPDPDQNVINLNGGDGEPDEYRENAENDPLYGEAVAHVRNTGNTSISSIQRNLKIGYNRAAHMIERMESDGIVTELNTSGQRQVIGGQQAGGAPEQSLFDGGDELYQKALRAVVTEQRATIGWLQGALAVSAEQAAALLDLLEDRGVVGPANDLGGRSILWTTENIAPE